MKAQSSVAVLGVLSLALSACSSSQDAAKATGPSGSGDSGSQSGGGFEELAGYDWTADPGVESYWCIYKTLTEDLYVSAFRPVMPNGTHHVVIGYQAPGKVADGIDPEGTNGCTGTTFGDIFAYAGTVGTEELSMPAGVAVKIPKGQQLVFGLHVNNLGTEPIGGRAGVEVRMPDPSKVAHEAEVIAVIDPALSIPPGTVQQSADCTVPADGTYFAVMPHMHMLGKHMTTTTVTAKGPGPELFNADYTFTEQQYKPLSPTVQLAKGDKIHIQCDYENPGTTTVGFGEKTVGQEMCITFAYRYPAVASTLPANPGFARGNCWDGPTATP